MGCTVLDRTMAIVSVPDYVRPLSVMGVLVVSSCLIIGYTFAFAPYYRWFMNHLKVKDFQQCKLTQQISWAAVVLLSAVLGVVQCFTSNSLYVMIACFAALVPFLALFYFVSFLVFRLLLKSLKQALAQSLNPEHREYTKFTPRAYQLVTTHLIWDLQSAVIFVFSSNIDSAERRQQ